ncbi:mRNA-degrading endonuclease [Clostridia bacterium]|nr:mRNA-degrading endonuclease [Clostridia bacterium]
MRQGDIIKLDFNPTVGHEQSGYRPAVVVSSNTFNARLGIRLVCPITRTDRGYPLHIRLDNRTQTTGFIMCEQVKAIDSNARSASVIERLPPDLLEKVVQYVTLMFEIDET